MKIASGLKIVWWNSVKGRLNWLRKRTGVFKRVASIVLLFDEVVNIKELTVQEVYAATVRSRAWCAVILIRAAWLFSRLKSDLRYFCDNNINAKVRGLLIR